MTHEAADPASIRYSDTALLTSVATNLRKVILPELTDAWSRSVAIQLIALVELAHSRGDDPASARRDELTAALGSLAGNPLLEPHVGGEPYAVASAVLAEAMRRDDDDAHAVQAVLRPLLVEHLDSELASTTRLTDAFRGVIHDA